MHMVLFLNVLILKVTYTWDKQLKNSNPFRLFEIITLRCFGVHPLRHFSENLSLSCTRSSKINQDTDHLLYAGNKPLQNTCVKADVKKYVNEECFRAKLNTMWPLYYGSWPKIRVDVLHSSFYFFFKFISFLRESTFNFVRFLNS